MKAPTGIKGRVAAVLEASDRPLSMSEVMGRAGIEKTMANEVSSALYKLRNQGKVKTVRGESTSKNGPKFVRHYSWVSKPARPVKPTPQIVLSPLQMLGVGRLG